MLSRNVGKKLRYTLRKITNERGSNLHRGIGLKSREPMKIHDDVYMLATVPTHTYHPLEAIAGPVSGTSSIDTHFKYSF
jgi:hypothetical protein